MTGAYRDELEHPSPSIQSREAMVADVVTRARSLQQAARVLYLRWLQEFPRD